MRKRLAAMIPAAVVLLAAPAAADGAVVYGICGPSICKIDPATSSKRVLLRGTRGHPYASVSVSLSGKRMAFVRDQEVFRAGRDGRRAKRVGTALRLAAPDVNVRPDGRELSWITIEQRLDVCPTPPCGFVQQRELDVLAFTAAPKRTRVVASDLYAAGWLRSRIVRQAFGDGDAPWFICAWDASDGCVSSVAVDPVRSLTDPAGSPDGSEIAAVALADTDEVAGPIALFDAATGTLIRDLADGVDLDPAFSPDGRRVAFVRGRDLYAVPRGGGRARRLARNVTDPAWARR